MANETMDTDRLRLSYKVRLVERMPTRQHPRDLTIVGLQTNKCYTQLSQIQSDSGANVPNLNAKRNKNL